MIEKHKSAACLIPHDSGGMFDHRSCWGLRPYRRACFSSQQNVRNPFDASLMMASRIAGWSIVGESACCCLSSSLAMCTRFKSEYSKLFISKFIPCSASGSTLLRPSRQPSNIGNLKPQGKYSLAAMPWRHARRIPLKPEICAARRQIE
jgi:hypothetical protein